MITSGIGLFNPLNPSDWNNLYTSWFGVTPDATADYITGSNIIQPPPASVVATPGLPEGWQTGVTDINAPQNVSNQQILDTQQNIQNFVGTQGYSTSAGINPTWWFVIGGVLIVGWILLDSHRGRRD